MRTVGTVRFVDLQAQHEALQPALGNAVARVVERGDFILGADVAELEREFADYIDVPHAIGVDSGFSALELALRALGIGPGDEVITQSNTFIASAGAILAVGARPVLVDCDAWGHIDPDAVRAAITPRTRAIMPVHLFGRICEIEPVLTNARSAGIAVVEDACQAHGAVWRNRRAGSFGDAAAFSFYPSKNMGCFGDGGMLVVGSDTVSSAARAIRNYGQRTKYEHVTIPFNRRLDTIQAAVLRVKLPHLDNWNQRRIRHADRYRELLQGLPIRLPPAEDGRRHVYHLFVIQTEDRDGLQAALNDAGVETGVHYPIPLHLQPALADLGYAQGAFPHTETLAASSLSLPMYPELGDEQIERVAAVIRRYFGR